MGWPAAAPDADRRIAATPQRAGRRYGVDRPPAAPAAGPARQLRDAADGAPRHHRMGSGEWRRPSVAVREGSARPVVHPLCLAIGRFAHCRDDPLQSAARRPAIRKGARRGAQPACRRGKAKRERGRLRPVRRRYRQGAGRSPRGGGDAAPMTFRPASAEDAAPGWRRQAGQPARRAGWRGTRGPAGVRGPRQARSAQRSIIFLNRFFYPDHSATSQILTDLAFHLADYGIDVRVVTSRQRYDDPNAPLAAAESIGHLTIDRIAATRFGRSALPGRGLDYLSFYAAAYRSVVAWAKPGDVLVAKTDPPLLSVAALVAARRGGLHLVNWLQDLYPEIASGLGVPFAKGPLGRGLRQLRDRSLRAAAANVVVGEGMAEILRRRGIRPEHIRVIPNWCDDEEIRPLMPSDNPLRREWGLADRFVVGYSGNLGRGHEFETVLAAAECLRNDRSLCFLFIGGGNKFAELARAVRERRLDHLFQFLPYQDRSVLKLS